MLRPAFLLLCLVGCTFAAPSFDESDTIVPETTLVSMDGKEGLIVLKRQWAQVQESIKMGVTPGVKATIDKMVVMVDEQIEPAIHDAHKADQLTLDDMMQDIADLNTGFEGQLEILNQ